MRHPRTWSAALLLLAATSSLPAQDFRIVTTVRDPQQTGPDGQPAGGLISLTLFHHQKVYDYIDTLGEVIVYEPRKNRFTILSMRRSLAATIDFDEVKRLLKARGPQIDRYIAKLRQNKDRRADAIAAAFKFQLDPAFEESWDEQTGRLTLDSSRWLYRVSTADVERPERVKDYLEYADWISRLNCVLHPGAMFPEPRLALNASLRRHRRMPVQVELKTTLDGGLHRIAEHSIGWKLESHDLALITEWEAALKSPRTRRTSFRGYQQAVLAAR